MLKWWRKRPRFRYRIEKRIARLTWPEGRGIVRRDGILYLLNLKRLQCDDKHTLQWGAAEPAQREYLLSQIRRRNCVTFLDVGANFGLYAACVALQTNCSTIIAYEPDQRSYDRLRIHLDINGLTDRVQTRMEAVTNQNGSVPFVRGSTYAESLSKVGNDGSGFSVPAVRLDDRLPLTGQRIALKIDIEGHELAALQGMKSLLQSNNCFLQVECWAENAAPFIAEMQDEGYRLLHRIAGDHYDYYFAREE
jgi:FkbM family methyltransferase